MLVSVIAVPADQAAFWVSTTFGPGLPIGIWRGF